jgi:hypothetical protein
LTDREVIQLELPTKAIVALKEPEHIGTEDMQGTQVKRKPARIHKEIKG